MHDLKTYNNKNVQNFKVGDKVAVRIPRIDRTTTDVHHLPCVIIQCYGKKHFYISCNVNLVF